MSRPERDELIKELDDWEALVTQPGYQRWIGILKERSGVLAQQALDPDTDVKQREVVVNRRDELETATWIVEDRIESLRRYLS
jgi:hypothetical protein